MRFSRNLEEEAQADLHQATDLATKEKDKGKLEKEDSLEYQHGQLGLVPMS